ncbi:MAG TPA: hypothetical protein VFH13_04885, partial [Gemmatimonadaceae bacterium]|nr:hypothetical protein [Gemmatimonadaceae bacterium]
SGIEGAEAYFVTVARFALGALMPMLVAFAAFGDPLLNAVFGGFLAEESIDLMYDLGLILAGLAVAGGIMHLGGVVMFALGRSLHLLACAAAAVAFQCALVIPLAHGEPSTTAGLHVVASGCSTVLLLSVLFGRAWPRIILRILQGTIPAIMLSAVFVLVRLPLGSDPSVPALAVAVSAGLLLYAGLSLFLWSGASRAFVRPLRR